MSAIDTTSGGKRLDSWRRPFLGRDERTVNRWEKQGLPVPDDTRRERGDRPQVVPPGWSNLAFTGQFCELPDDVVFTVEYSIRSAQTAVYDLLRLNRKPPAVYKGQFDPPVQYKAFTTLHGMKP